MPRNIVVCCDGTGNKFGPRNSNVVNLAATLIQDEGQVCYYHPGVGTQGSPTSRNRMQEIFSVMMGMGFGSGLLDYVGDAYRFLMDTYEPGDKIYLFGFSRGAYTVRALSGMLHMFGLLHPGNNGLIDYILKMFARHTRNADGMQEVFEEATDFKATFSHTVEIQMVGVWDTVSSVGYIWDPLKLPYTARNPCMKHGRHAVSIDERRCFFRNNLWGVAYPDQSIKQIWFAGVHSDVGGSYPPTETGLSQITLRWMLCEAVAVGLRVDSDKARKAIGPAAPYPGPDPAQCIHQSLKRAWWILEYIPHRDYDPVVKKVRWIIPHGRPRQIPPGSVFHPTVKEKMAVDPTYKPVNLPSGWEGCLAPIDPCEF